MTDLNKMFPKFTEMDFSENDVVVLPFRSLIGCCPDEALGEEKRRFLKELKEKCNCEKEKTLYCDKCWRRASKIAMEHYFGKEELKR